MRPKTLEMIGFSAFRAQTVIDFTGHDLIAFTGPTGAGKSSIIDGIVFALYGSVARYENEKLVAPIINAVSTEARIRLDFSVGDTDYTAVRVVRRTKGGASTKEARLERGDAVLASTAQEVTAQVELLLGLSFNQFTKTCVLPQGDFARFLTEKSSTRQRLLRRLLGLDLFADLGKAARQRSRDIVAEGLAFERALKEGPTITESDLDTLRAQVSELDEALAKLAVATTDRATTRAELLRAESDVARREDERDSLVGLAMPAEVRSFASNVAKAQRELEAKRKKLTATEKKFETAAGARAKLPATAEIESVIESHEQLDLLIVQRGDQEAALKDAAEQLDTATAAADLAGVNLATAERALQDARVRAGAQGIAAILHPGDQCPVCDQVVAEVPDHAGHAEIADVVRAAEETRDERTTEVRSMIADVRTATATHAERKAMFEATKESITTLRERTVDEPTHKQASALLTRIVAADDKVEETQATVGDANDAVDLAIAQLSDAQENGAALRRDFTAARDRVAALEPPAPGGESLKDDWAALAEWAKTVLATTKKELREESKGVTAANKRLEIIDRTMISLSRPFTAPGIEADPDESESVLQNAHADARIVLANSQDRRDRQNQNRERLGELEGKQAVADELGKHLASGMFERWIMGDVMLDLAERATVRLGELSAGAYSLTTDGRDFQIRDHRNADELRSARTLSGGETFLTSLSLALALADSITELASTISPPIESMFLDEGFGTLDPETLDTVATAIEDLGASGRMIGIVTHIRDLADRLPVRFDVQRGAKGSTVTPIG